MQQKGPFQVTAIPHFTQKNESVYQDQNREEIVRIKPRQNKETIKDPISEAFSFQGFEKKPKYQYCLEKVKSIGSGFL